MVQLRFHARGGRAAPRADLEDICSEKALELLGRAESGAWQLAGRTGSEISGYVSKAARNGWLDLQARRKREPTMTEWEGNASAKVPLRLVTEDSGPIDRTEGAELVRALRECVRKLTPRSRRVWFFRGYYGMTGREIAEHPMVRLNAAHVDVLVQRARQALRECMQGQGHALEGAPRGAFVELWDLLDSLAAEEGNDALDPAGEGEAT